MSYPSPQSQAVGHVSHFCLPSIEFVFILLLRWTTDLNLYASTLLQMYHPQAGSKMDDLGPPGFPNLVLVEIGETASTAPRSPHQGDSPESSDSDLGTPGFTTAPPQICDDGTSNRRPDTCGGRHKGRGKGWRSGRHGRLSRGEVVVWDDPASIPDLGTDRAGNSGSVGLHRMHGVLANPLSSMVGLVPHGVIQGQIVRCLAIPSDRLIDAEVVVYERLTDHVFGECPRAVLPILAEAALIGVEAKQLHASLEFTAEASVQGTNLFNSSFLRRVQSEIGVSVRAARGYRRTLSDETPTRLRLPCAPPVFWGVAKESGAQKSSKSIPRESPENSTPETHHPTHKANKNHYK